MDQKKFEKLIDLIINENEDQARELFHEIVVEKSRHIYESIMDEEMMADGEGHGMHGQVGDLMDEISVEEEGMYEADGEMEMDMEVDGPEGEIEAGEVFPVPNQMSDVSDSDDDDLEARVERAEDKLDTIMAEFERIMGKDSDEEDMDVEVDDEDEEEEDFDDEEEEEEEEDTEDEDEVMEAVQLQKVAVHHGDNGSQTRSTVAANSGAKGMDSKPVKFSGHNEAVPNGPKAPSNSYTKGEKEVPGAGSFKNVPGGKARVALNAAPKPVTKDASAYRKSPVAKG
jgi:hypothetical protein